MLERLSNGHFDRLASKLATRTLLPSESSTIVGDFIMA